MSIKSKEEITRSQVIRDYLKTCKPSESSPKLVSEALAEKGLKVSASLVSYVKSALRRSIRKTAAKNAVAKKQKNISDFTALICAKDLLKLVGGDIAKAKKNLEIVSKLLS